MVVTLKYVDYLKDPNLVLRFQQYFGVCSAANARKRTKANGNIILNESSITGTDPPCDKVGSYVKTKNLTQADNNIIKDKNAINGKEVELKSVSPRKKDAHYEKLEGEKNQYVITNRFWYYFFLFGTYLGDEIFYATFIPFWFWNIDGAVGRRIVIVWTIVMYIGQGVKDIVCWPRPPSPPVFRLQKKWSLEHGMPSTHAMVGVAIPFSVIIYTMSRYQYPVFLGVIIAVFWCATISLSRIYLGMHSVLDVVVGLVMAVLLMVPVVPMVDALDVFLVTSRWSPILLITATIPMIIFYPTTDHWTPTREDTTMILCFGQGVYIGAWTNYHMGAMAEPPSPPPYAIIWPSWPMCGMGALRTAMGLCSIIATIAVCKSAQAATMRCILPQSPTSPHSLAQRSTTKNVIRLVIKYITYSLLGFNVLYLMPNVFKLLNIERPTFYTEL